MLLFALGLLVGVPVGGLLLFLILAKPDKPELTDRHDLPVDEELLLLGFYYPGRKFVQDKDLWEPSVLLKVSGKRKQFLVLVDVTNCPDLWSLQSGDVLVRKGLSLERKRLNKLV